MARSACVAALGCATVLGGFGSATVSADILYEDIFYWTPSDAAQPGLVDVVVNPANPPLNAWVKIQETVYDDAQSRQVLEQQAAFGIIHGDDIPTEAMNLYVYSITNLTYGTGPISGLGTSIAGFTVNNIFGVDILGLWAPSFAVNWWDGSVETAQQDADWQIDANMNGLSGDGLGIPLGATFSGFMFAVADGTPHGVLPASVNGWSGQGEFEEPMLGQTDITIGGLVSGPVPAPATALVLLGAMSLRRRR